MTTTRYLQVNMNGAWKDVCQFEDAGAHGDLVRRGAVYIADCANRNPCMRIVDKRGRETLEIARCHAGLGWHDEAANDSRVRGGAA